MDYKTRPRKTISFNEHTIHISLPADWCRSHGVKQKQFIDATIASNGDLILRPVK